MKLFMKTSLILILLAACSACVHRSSGKGLLPPPPPGPLKESPYRPDTPLAPDRDGLLSRLIHRAAEAPFSLETKDWLVPPGKKVLVAEAAGVLVFVQDGAGQARQRGKESQLNPGATFAFSEGDRAEIENTGKVPLILRVYIVRGQ